MYLGRRVLLPSFVTNGDFLAWRCFGHSIGLDFGHDPLRTSSYRHSGDATNRIYANKKILWMVQWL